MFYQALIFAFSLTCWLDAVSNGAAQPTQAKEGHGTGTVTLSVLSFNIHHGADKAEQDRLDEMAQVIIKAGADLVGLQEVDIGCTRSGKVDQMKRLAELTGMHPAYAEHYPYNGGSYGLGLLSKYPLANIRNDRITLKNKDGTTETRALLSATAEATTGIMVSIATVHMALDQPSRLMQAREIIQFMEKETVPVILTGDLNAQPGTEEIRLLETAFTDTDTTEKLTFPVDNPVKKIDYIFLGRDHKAEIISHEVLSNEKQSDHLPVISEFKFAVPAGIRAVKQEPTPG